MSDLITISRFLRRTGMADTKFGRLVCNDATLMRRIRAGAEIKSATAAKIDSFIRNYRTEEEPS